MPNYGIWQEKDLALDALAADVDRDSLLDATQETFDSHNGEVNTFVGLFCDRVTLPQLSVRTGGSNRNQPLDENGRPKPVKAAGRYIVGLPLWKSGSAYGANFWTDAQKTVRQRADDIALMLRGDVTWVRDEILAPFFYAGAGFPYVDAARGESFTVYGLANGDATVFDKSSGSGTDSHLSAQLAGLGTGADDPFPAIDTELTEHPLNTGRLVAFINPVDAPAVRLLNGFSPADRNIIQVVPAVGSATVDPLEAPALNLPLSASMKYIGIKDSTYVVTWQNMPANYMLTVAVDAEEKALAMREYPQPALQGFINIGEPMSQFPYQQNNFVRAAGFGARNRTAAHVHYFGVSATYAAPTNFPFPLA